MVTGKFSGVTSFSQSEINANGYYDYFVGTLEYGVDIEDDTIVPAADITLTAYPNPFTSQLNCSLISKTMKPMDVSIYNLKGQRVRHFAQLQGNSFIGMAGRKTIAPLVAGYITSGLTRDHPQ